MQDKCIYTVHSKTMIPLLTEKTPLRATKPEQHFTSRHVRYIHFPPIEHTPGQAPHTIFSQTT